MLRAVHFANRPYAVAVMQLLSTIVIGVNCALPPRVHVC